MFGTLYAGIGDLVAAAAVTGGTGATTGKLDGIAAVVRNGAGDYGITLAGGGIDATNADIDVTLADGLDGFCQHLQTTDTAIRVLTFSDAGAAEDHDFHFSILRRGIG